MRYLVDSDWVADYLGGQQAAVELLDGLVPEGIAVSIITLGEIYEGIYFGRDPRRTEAIFGEFLRMADVVVLNRRIMQRFARLRGELRHTGQLIGDPDILIAASALQHGLIVVTRNRRHFERIAGLQLL